MMMKQTVMPAGFRFCPTEEELINSYLRPKIKGQILPCNIIEEKQLYGAADPWDVLHDGNQWMVSETKKLGKVVKKTIYVFTKLTKKATAGKMRKHGGKEQFVRAAGCGTWDGQTGPREVKDGNGQVIGFRRMLVFEITSALNPSPNPSKSSASANPGHWIMHEYSLPGGESDYVVCEIILDLNKKSKRKRGVEEDQVDQEVVTNPKRLMTNIDQEKKDDEENVIVCCAGVPLVHEEEEGLSGMESQVLRTPAAVDYPDHTSCTTDDHELMPMTTESQEQTLEWDDFIDLDELLGSENEAGPSGMESQVLPLAAVDNPNTSSTTDHELMPMTSESQQQTLEWDDFVDLDELLGSENEAGPSGMEYSQVLFGVEYPNTTSTDHELIMPMMESQQQTLQREWDNDFINQLDSEVPRFDLVPTTECQEQTLDWAWHGMHD